MLKAFDGKIAKHVNSNECVFGCSAYFLKCSVCPLCHTWLQLMPNHLLWFTHSCYHFNCIKKWISKLCHAVNCLIFVLTIITRCTFHAVRISPIIHIHQVIFSSTRPLIPVTFYLQFKCHIFLLALFIRTRFTGNRISMRLTRSLWIHFE